MYDKLKEVLNDNEPWRSLGPTRKGFPLVDKFLDEVVHPTDRDEYERSVQWLRRHMSPHEYTRFRESWPTPGSEGSFRRILEKVRRKRKEMEAKNESIIDDYAVVLDNFFNDLDTAIAKYKDKIIEIYHSFNTHPEEGEKAVEELEQQVQVNEAKLYEFLDMKKRMFDLLQKHFGGTGYKIAWLTTAVLWFVTTWGVVKWVGLGWGFVSAILWQVIFAGYGRKAKGSLKHDERTV